MTVIEARGLRKAFGATIALDSIDLHVEEGRILDVPVQEEIPPRPCAQANQERLLQVEPMVRHRRGARIHRRQRGSLARSPSNTSCTGLARASALMNPRIHRLS